MSKCSFDGLAHMWITETAEYGGGQKCAKCWVWVA